MTIIDDIKAGRITLEEAREKIRRKNRRNEAMGAALAVGGVMLLVAGALAWQIILPVIGLLWLFGGLA